MKKRFFVVTVSSICALASVVVAARPKPDKDSAEAIDPVSGVAVAAAGLNYSTGFEPGEGFSLGYISNSGGTPAGCGGVAFPCWGHTTSNTCPSGAPGQNCNFSVITPTIENVHPASGAQHLRLTHDPTTRTNIPAHGFAIDARYPRTSDLTPRPFAPNTVSVDIAISAPGGQNFRVQPQSNSQGFLATSVLFDYTGEIYVLYGLCFYDGDPPIWPVPTGHQWDTTGAYQNFTVAMDPCPTDQNGPGYDGDGVVNFYYGGVPIFSGCATRGTNLEQFLVFGDNYPGSSMDIDNLVMTSLDDCPHVCGNGVIEYAYEQCEVTPGGDANCPGRCIAAGQPGECTCTPICTQQNPCPVENGENGPYISSSGIYFYEGESPFVSVDGCGTDFDASLVLGTTMDWNHPLVSNYTCSLNNSGSDPSAPCFGFNQQDPCTCVANPGKPIFIRLSPSGFIPPGSVSFVNVRKKAACAGASVGTCCDTNGSNQGCTDNITEADCTGPDKVWTDQGKCVDQQCECIPDCTGAACGSDGCGGSCGGTCDDGDPCNGVETCNANRTCDAGTLLVCDDGNACNGLETCNPQTGCVPGTPLSCSDGVACNGMETCNPSSGCVAGTPVNCDDGIDCTVDTCNEPSGSCSHDNADCAIPTTSQWGLVALALLLLIAAKTQFRRPGCRAH